MIRTIARRPTLRGIASMTVLAVVSFILARGPNDAVSNPVARLDTSLDYALQDFNADLLDENGDISVRLVAPYLRNNASSGIGTVERPDIHVQQDEEIWHITADSAIITADRQFVSMTGPVKIKQQNRLAGTVLNIDTRDVMISVALRTATSDAPVKLRQEGDELEAVGLKLDMIRNSYELLSEVRGTYATP